MLFQVTHATRYIYEAPVPYCINEARLIPRKLPGQEPMQSSISVEPAPGFLHHRKDYFGNDVTSFGVFEKHETFAAIAESLVEVRADVSLPDSSMPWEEVKELVALHSDAACFEALEFKYDSPFVRTSVQLAEYAGKTFELGRPLMDAVRELSHRIHTEFEYKTASTSIDMPLSEVLQKRRGVCQDFAHIMMCHAVVEIARAICERVCTPRTEGSRCAGIACLGFRFSSEVWLAQLRSDQRRDAVRRAHYARLGTRLRRRHTR